jgi:hypothetical protein
MVGRFKGQQLWDVRQQSRGRRGAIIQSNDEIKSGMRLGGQQELPQFRVHRACHLADRVWDGPLPSELHTALFRQRYCGVWHYKNVFYATGIGRDNAGSCHHPKWRELVYEWVRRVQAGLWAPYRTTVSRMYRFWEGRAEKLLHALGRKSF